MSCNQYIENARKVLSRAEEGMGSGRIDKPCHKCRFHKYSFLELRSRCTNPIVVLAASQAEDEYGMKRLISPSEQRSKYSCFGTIVCGPEAVLFEDK